MTKIFIEAANKTTPECNFLKAFIKTHFPSKEVDFVCVGGVSNLFNEPTSIRFFNLKKLESKRLF